MKLGMIGTTGQFLDVIRSWEMCSNGEFLPTCLGIDTDGCGFSTAACQEMPAQEESEKGRAYNCQPWTSAFTNSLTKTDMFADMYECYTKEHDVKHETTGEEAFVNDFCGVRAFAMGDSENQGRYYGSQLAVHSGENTFGRCLSVGQNYGVKTEAISPVKTPQNVYTQVTENKRPLSKAGRKRRECQQDLQLPKAELERKERRRQQNRRAAEKCRQKKKAQHSRTLADYQKSQETHTKLEQHVRVLEKQKQLLEQQLHRHLGVCQHLHLH